MTVVSSAPPPWRAPTFADVAEFAKTRACAQAIDVFTALAHPDRAEHQHKNGRTSSPSEMISSCSVKSCHKLALMISDFGLNEVTEKWQLRDLFKFLAPRPVVVRDLNMIVDQIQSPAMSGRWRSGRLDVLERTVNDLASGNSGRGRQGNMVRA